MTSIYKRLTQPMDARSKRGVFSRGKPVYGFGRNAPNKPKSFPGAFDATSAAKERLANERRKRSKSS